MKSFVFLVLFLVPAAKASSEKEDQLDEVALNRYKRADLTEAELARFKRADEAERVKRNDDALVEVEQSLLRLKRTRRAIVKKDGRSAGFVPSLVNEPQEGRQIVKPQKARSRTSLNSSDKEKHGHPERSQDKSIPEAVANGVADQRGNWRKVALNKHPSKAKHEHLLRLRRKAELAQLDLLEAQLDSFQKKHKRAVPRRPATRRRGAKKTRPNRKNRKNGRAPQKKKRN